MRGRHFAALLAAAFLYPIADSYAASVFRCVGADGHVTFTRHGCSDDQEQHLQDARNHTPSSGKAIPLADPDRRTATASASSGELVIVGQQDDGCGNLLSSSERRQAIIRKEVRRGMSRADVESSLGKPDRVTSSNGQQRYHYREKRKGGSSRQVSFDEAGCVKGK
ncbi:outer membrane protein assembly factor BamE [Ectopseudomonas composti]